MSIARRASTLAVLGAVLVLGRPHIATPAPAPQARGVRVAAGSRPFIPGAVVRPGRTLPRATVFPNVPQLGVEIARGSRPSVPGTVLLSRLPRATQFPTTIALGLEVARGSRPSVPASVLISRLPRATQRPTTVALGVDVTRGGQPRIAGAITVVGHLPRAGSAAIIPAVWTRTGHVLVGAHPGIPGRVAIARLPRVTQSSALVALGVDVVRSPQAARPGTVLTIRPPTRPGLTRRPALLVASSRRAEVRGVVLFVGPRRPTAPLATGLVGTRAITGGQRRIAGAVVLVGRLPRTGTAPIIPAVWSRTPRVVTGSHPATPGRATIARLPRATQVRSARALRLVSGNDRGRRGVVRWTLLPSQTGATPPPPPIAAEVTAFLSSTHPPSPFTSQTVTSPFVSTRVSTSVFLSSSESSEFSS